MNIFRVPRPTRLTAAAVVAALAVTAAACGGDDDDAADPTPAPAATSEAPATDAAPTEPPSETASETPAETPTTTPTSDAPADAAFPVTIQHKYGETTIESKPERVVSIGFAEHDGLLALGIKPVAVRDWYGEQPYATWPWAQDELGDQQPEVLQADALNFEQIAALRPDVILGIASGMTDTDYATLSAIAPTVAQSADYVEYGSPWDVTLATDALATGYSAEAERLIAETKARFAEVREAHPEWAGLEAGVTYLYEGQPGGYASEDVRARFLADIGLATASSYDALAGDQFWFTVSPERLPELDTDVLVWLGDGDAAVQAIRDLPLRPSLTAYAEGREILADPMLAGAFSHANPLSFDYVLEHLVPELELALDGDPATVVPSAIAIDPNAEAPAIGEDAATADAEQAAADVWSLVFDSTVPFADKAAHIEDADALEATVESYTTAGAAMGGIALEPTAVSVDGTTATVTYDVLFGGNAAYTALVGRIDLVDGTWVVGRDEFCGFMASARNACPA